MTAVVHSYLTELELCGSEGYSCDRYELCELLPVAAGAEYESCLRDDDHRGTATGYCYLDGMTDRDGDGVLECEIDGSRDDCLGNPELLRDCPPSSRRWLRLVSPPDAAVPLPWPGSVIHVFCQGELAPTG